MKPACRCGDAWTLHCHDHGEYKTATWCARWDHCGCDKYRRRRWLVRLTKGTR